MFDIQRKGVALLPSAEIVRSMYVAQAARDHCGEEVVPGGIARRQPACGSVGEHLLFNTVLLAPCVAPPEAAGLYCFLGKTFELGEVCALRELRSNVRSKLGISSIGQKAARAELTMAGACGVGVDVAVPGAQQVCGLVQLRVTL